MWGVTCRWGRGLAWGALVLLALAGSRAEPSRGSPAAAVFKPPRLSWGGTLTYAETFHYETSGRVTIDESISAKITETESGHATFEATYDRKSVSVCPQGTTTTTEHGSVPAGRPLVNAVTVSKSGDRYSVDPPSGLDVPTDVTYADGCGVKTPPPPKSSRDASFDSPPMDGPLKPGQKQLSGTRSEDFVPASGCTPSTCSGKRTVTWHLARSKDLEIVKLALYDRDPLYGVQSKDEAKKGLHATEFTRLEFLSTSKHPWYSQYGSNGKPTTPIWGTIRLDGFAGDSVKSLELKIEDEAGHVVTADLSSNSGLPRGTFSGGPAEVKAISLLFELSAADAERLDAAQAEDQDLKLRVEAVSDWGDRAERNLKPVQQLVRYALPNRYGETRDPSYGGDSWVTPETRRDLTWITAHAKIEFLWGDRANMNGGRFYPHLSHGDGKNIDGFFERFYTLKYCNDVPNVEGCHPTSYAASVLVALLRTKVGADIEAIFVTHQAYEPFGDPFFAELKYEDKQGRLPDGRLPSAVIRPWPNHETHFHIRFKR
jgi:hypothetical protein